MKASEKLGNIPLTARDRRGIFEELETIETATGLKIGSIAWYRKRAKDTPYRVEILERAKGSRSFVSVRDIEPDEPQFVTITTPEGEVRKPREYRGDPDKRPGVNKTRGVEFIAHVKHLRQ